MGFLSPLLRKVVCSQLLLKEEEILVIRILQNLLSCFCPNLNCITGYCSTHQCDTPLPLPVQPSLRSGDFETRVIKACGRDCFIYGTFKDFSHWTEEDIGFLEITLTYSPDTNPCDLAEICDKPCFEAFKKRQELLPDDDTVKSVQGLKGTRATRSNSTNVSVDFEDLDRQFYSLNDSRADIGPCTVEASDCICHLNKGHCT